MESENQDHLEQTLEEMTLVGRGRGSSCIPGYAR